MRDFITLSEAITLAGMALALVVLATLGWLVQY